MRHATQKSMRLAFASVATLAMVGTAMAAPMSVMNKAAVADVTPILNRADIQPVVLHHHYVRHHYVRRHYVRRRYYYGGAGAGAAVAGAALGLIGGAAAAASGYGYPYYGGYYGPGYGYPGYYYYGYGYPGYYYGGW